MRRETRKLVVGYGGARGGGKSAAGRPLIKNTLDGNWTPPDYYSGRMPADVADYLRARGDEIRPDLAPLEETEPAQAAT